MYEIDSKLKQRQIEGNPIQVGLIGAGQMGSEIVTQVGLMEGMEIAVVVDLTGERAADGFGYMKEKPQVLVTDDLKEAEKEVSRGKKIATTNSQIATRLPQVDVIIDATGSVEMGAVTSLDAIDYGRT